MSGVRIRTRKRNIVVPHDPQSFADALIIIIDDAREGLEEGDRANVAKVLDAANKASITCVIRFHSASYCFMQTIVAAETLDVADVAELDFSRYGDTLFEVAFVGARLTTGGSVATEGKKLDINVLACPADAEAILPWIKWFQSMIRRRPFLVKALENVLQKFVMGLEFYDDEGRHKIAIALARCFSLKVGILPESILPKMLVDRLVLKGTVLQFATEFFKEFLACDTLEHLMEILRKARLDSQMLEFFPPQKRTWAEFDAYFQAAGLDDLVQYTAKRRYDEHCQVLAELVQGMVADDPPAKADAVIAEVKAKKAEWGLEDADVAKWVFVGLVQSVMANIGSKNTQQVQFSVLKTLKTQSKTLSSFCTSARLEAGLLNHIQDRQKLAINARLICTGSVKILYDGDVLGEDTIRFWYNKGSSPKGRNVFLKNMEPFMNWLDEAEEDESDEE
ncbi:hypothetical protein COHA_005339 [Chlorella ohadii]|uniref:W2 domain-containing protein n=1 Tax=Chlorella ohadii TaxID=2649997 RepID=A0AAD5H1W4_9CHLO|nr:hypothetical protein COHA_005339 [Chlorella ohadii]